MSPLGSFAFLRKYFQAGSLKHGLQPPLQQHTKHAASCNSGNQPLVNHLLSTSVARNLHIGPFSSKSSQKFIPSCICRCTQPMLRNIWTPYCVEHMSHYTVQ